MARPVEVGQLRSEIGADGLRQAAIDAGRRPPSARTIRRWVKNNRIPHPDIAELVQRRGLVHRYGGVKAAADAIGVSESTVSRFQRGETKTLRPTTERGVQEASATDALTRKGVAERDGTLHRRPVVTVKAEYQYRNHGNTSDDYRAYRTFEIDLGEGVTSADFAMAAARSDHAAQIAILERHLTMDYATTFDRFDDDSGFHMNSVLDFEVDWQ